MSGSSEAGTMESSSSSTVTNAESTTPRMAVKRSRSSSHHMNIEVSTSFRDKLQVLFRTYRHKLARKKKSPLNAYRNSMQIESPLESKSSSDNVATTTMSSASNSITDSETVASSVITETTTPRESDGKIITSINEEAASVTGGLFDNSNKKQWCMRKVNRIASMYVDNYEKNLADEIEKRKIKTISEMDDETKNKVINELKLISFAGQRAVFEEEEIDECLNQLSLVEYKAGEEVIRQGDEGDIMYIVQEGKLQAMQDGYVRSIYNNSGFFGELALMYNSPRMASVRAITDCKLWTLMRSAYQRVIKSIQLTHIDHAIHAIKRVPIFYKLTAHQIEQIAVSLEHKVFPSNVQLIRQGEKGEYLYILAEGEAVCLQDNCSEALWHFRPGDLFGEGSLIDKHAVCNANVFTITRCVCYTLARDQFYNVMGPVSTLLRDSFVLRVLCKLDIFKRLQMSEQEFLRLAETVKQLRFRDNEIIVQQGDAGGRLYIVIQGTVEFTSKKELENQNQETQHVGMLNVGGYFGEESFLPTKDNDPSHQNQLPASPVTAIAKGDTSIFIITLKDTEESFKQLLKAHYHNDNIDCLNNNSPRFIKRAQSFVNSPSMRGSPSDSSAFDFPNIMEKGKEQLSRSMSFTVNNQPQNGPPKFNTQSHGLVVSLDELEPLSILGKGAFGTVILVLHQKKYNTVYALKLMKKSKIIKHRQEGNVHREKQLLKEIGHHPFITNLIRTFKDEQFVYILLEAALCGDLITFMKNRFRLSNGMEQANLNTSEAVFIAAQVVLALDHIHKHHCIYRDLKPENCILAADGYIKLTDMGLAKKLDQSLMERTFTFCGTPAFLAPEVFRMRGYGREIDLWALGVFLYEVLLGEMPFKADSVQQFGVELEYFTIHYDAIGNGSHPFFRTLNQITSRKEVDFIHKILNPNPIQRLGSSAGGILDIKTHAMFTSNSIDFQSVLEKKAVIPASLSESIAILNEKNYLIRSESPLRPSKPKPEGDIRDTMDDSMLISKSMLHDTNAAIMLNSHNNDNKKFKTSQAGSNEYDYVHYNVPLIGIPAPSWDEGF